MAARWRCAAASVASLSGDGCERGVDAGGVCGVGEDVGADEALHGRQEGATTARTEAMRRYWRGCAEVASVEEAAERGAWPRVTTWARRRKMWRQIAGARFTEEAAPNQSVASL